MKRLFLFLALVFSLAQFNNLGAQQAVQQEELYVGSITNRPMRIATWEGSVLALQVSIANSAWQPYNWIDYSAGQSWYLQISVINWASTSKAFKLEYDLRCADGATYYVYRSANTIAAGASRIYRIGISSYVAKLGVFTLTGRVYGTGMGNDNKVTTQAFVF